VARVNQPTIWPHPPITSLHKGLGGEVEGFKEERIGGEWWWGQGRVSTKQINKNFGSNRK